MSQHRAISFPQNMQSQWGYTHAQKLEPMKTRDSLFTSFSLLGQCPLRQVSEDKRHSGPSTEDSFCIQLTYWVCFRF